MAVRPISNNKSIQPPMNTPVQITIGTDAMPGDILKFSIIDSPQYGVVTSHVGKPLNFIIYAPNTGNLSFCLPFRVTAIVSCQRALLSQVNLVLTNIRHLGR
ncbi:MAG: hypothetical protein WBZ20_07810 [Nitrososphaeraceae archaeon]